MFLYKSYVFFIIFNLSWQMSLLTFDTICLNRKRLILVLMPINGIIAWIAGQFSISNNESVNMGEFFFIYFLVFSVLLVIFGIMVYKYLPADSAIIKDLSYNERNNYANFMLFFSCICVVILILNITENQKHIAKLMYSYITFNFLLIVNIFTNLILTIKVKSISNKLKN